MYQPNKEKLKKHLKDMIGREPTENEFINSQNDSTLIMKVMMEDFDELPKRVTDLEKKVKVVEDKIKV